MRSTCPVSLAIQLLGGTVLGRAHHGFCRPGDTISQPVGLHLLVAGDDAGDLFQATLDVLRSAAL